VGCGQPAPSVLGCGSIIRGIAFGFDSAEIRAESAGVLEELSRGLQADRSATILIEGHTSSEGTEEYNQRLSERRAQPSSRISCGVASARPPVRRRHW
jgi:outer membrane protein OmpA-like peptidoglycan-associated protein